MTYLSILEKLKILLNMLWDTKILLIFIGILLILTFIYCIKKITSKKYIILVLISLAVTFVISIITNYKILSNTFDNFTTMFFSNIYFPSIYAYIGILAITLFTFIRSILSRRQKRIYKIINSIVFILNSILLIIILNIIAKNKIDIFSIASLYTNKSLVAILEISTGLFIVWIITHLVIHTTNYICENRKKQTININSNLNLENNNVLVEENKILLENNNTLTEENKILSEDNNRINNEYNILLESNNTLTEENKILSENNNKLVEENTILIESNNKLLEEKNTILKEILASNNQNNNTFELDNILNGILPVTYYENNNISNNFEYDLANPQKIYEEKYNTKLEELRKEVSIQDIVEDTIVVEETINDIQSNEIMSVEEITRKQKEKLSKERLVSNTISLNELIEEKVEDKSEEKIIEVTLENSNEKNNTTYTVEDYKNMIKILHSLKHYSNNSNITIDDAISISLISNYTIEDCLKFKELLESNLN